MRPTHTTSVLTLLVMLIPALVQAQDQRNPFDQWDINKDGQLTKDELPQQAVSRFRQMDPDSDGVVTRDEMAVFMKRRKSNATNVLQPSNNPPARPADVSPRERVPAKAPTYADIKYGSHERHLMDVWLAESDEPTPVLVSIHGGGFRHGDKGVEPELRDACLKFGISVVAITYRLSPAAIAPAQFYDGARAIQFIRHSAKRWNIDPNRIAATGGSAGAGISLWLAFHDELADPSSNDRVLRHSSRLTCAAVSNGQTSYDPRFIRDLFPEDDQVYRIDALRELFDADLDHLNELPKEKLALFEEVSPIHHLTKDDVPALLTYMVKDSDLKSGIHNPKFGHILKKRMDQLGIRCEVVTHIDRDDPRYAAMVTDFIKDEFGMNRGSSGTNTRARNPNDAARRRRTKPNGEYDAPPTMDERVDSPLKIGDAAPDFSLKPYGGGEPMTLSQFKGRKPVVLVFGSITCGPFRKSVVETFDLQKKYADKAEFLMIYIREAHPESTILVEENGESALKEFLQTDTIAARVENAQSCDALLKVPFPMLIDGQDNATLAAYGAWPNRLVVIGKDGRIAWDSGEGPKGFRPDKLDQWPGDNL